MCVSVGMAVTAHVWSQRTVFRHFLPPWALMSVHQACVFFLAATSSWPLSSFLFYHLDVHFPLFFSIVFSEHLFAYFAPMWLCVNMWFCMCYSRRVKARGGQLVGIDPLLAPCVSLVVSAFIPRAILLTPEGSFF